MRHNDSFDADTLRLWFAWHADERASQGAGQPPAFACMNMRRIHDRKKQRFPRIEHARRRWAVVANSGQLGVLVAACIRSP